MGIPRIEQSANALRVSKPGYNVLDSLTQDQLMFDSAYQGFGVIITGSTTINVNGSASVYYVEIPFTSQSYVPVGVVSMSPGVDSRTMMEYLSFFITEIITIIFGFWIVVKNDSFRIYVRSNLNLGTLTFRYNIFSAAVT